MPQIWAAYSAVTRVLGDRLSAAVWRESGTDRARAPTPAFGTEIAEAVPVTPREEGKARMASYASNTVAGILIVGAALLAVVLVSGSLASI